MALHEWYLGAIIVISMMLVMINVYVWNHRRYPGVIYYFVINILALVMNASFYIITTTDSQTTAYDWMRIRFTALALIPMISVVFSTRFVRRPWWLNRRVEAVLWIVPILTACTMFIPDLTQYFFSHWSIVRLDGYNGETRSLGILYIVNTTHQFLCSFITFYLLFDYGLRVDSAWRRSVWYGVLPIAVMLVVANLPITLGPPPGLRITPLMIGFAAFGVGWTFLRDNSLSILPVAYDRILECVQDGVLVVNPLGLISKANPAAEYLIGAGTLFNHPIRDVLAVSDAVLLISQETHRFELTHHNQTLECESIPLYHDRRVIGRTLMLRDLTAHRQAEREALEMAYERERSHIMNQFLRETSNEFNTPVEAMRQALVGLQSPDESGYPDHIALIEGHIDNMTRQMQGLQKMAVEAPSGASHRIDAVALPKQMKP